MKHIEKERKYINCLYTCKFKVNLHRCSVLYIGRLCEIIKGKRRSVWPNIVSFKRARVFCCLTHWMYVWGGWCKTKDLFLSSSEIAFEGRSFPCYGWIYVRVQCDWVEQLGDFMLLSDVLKSCQHRMLMFFS